MAAASAEARTAGVTPGMPLASAQALVPDLHTVQAEPEADAEALRRLAVWCMRYAPLTAPDPPDGVWIDATGCTHLAGGEEALLQDLLMRLKHAGFEARAALAEAPGAAHAVARYGTQPAAVVAEGGLREALAPLPVEALRLSKETCEALRMMGLAEVREIMARPRAPLVRRFGSALALRLAQALGEQFEPIRPLAPPDLIERRLAFVEPLSTADAFATALEALMRFVCARLERAGLGTRRLDLHFERVDGSVQTLRIGTARPSRNVAHLTRLLRERLEQVDPGEGVEAMRLVAHTAEPLAFAQIDGLPREGEHSAQDLAGLVDRLANHFGQERVYRVTAVESDVPERSARRMPPLESGKAVSWPEEWPRPARLLTPPQPVMALAPLPDHPPAAFTWRRQRHRIRRACGPERIAGEWWKRDGEALAVRDYFAVEDERGRRFWLFRHGDGQDTATGDFTWYLHGFF